MKLLVVSTKTVITETEIETDDYMQSSILDSCNEAKIALEFVDLVNAIKRDPDAYLDDIDESYKTTHTEHSSLDIQPGK